MTIKNIVLHAIAACGLLAMTHSNVYAMEQAESGAAQDANIKGAMPQEDNEKSDLEKTVQAFFTALPTAKLIALTPAEQVVLNYFAGMNKANSECAQYALLRAVHDCKPLIVGSFVGAGVTQSCLPHSRCLVEYAADKSMVEKEKPWSEVVIALCSEQSKIVIKKTAEIQGYMKDPAFEKNLASLIQQKMPKKDADDKKEK